MSRRFRSIIYRRFFIIFLLISCLISLNQLISIPSLEDEQILDHRAVFYNISDPSVVTNLIDQFLNTRNYLERDEFWLLLVQSWSKSFENYLKRTETICFSSSSSFDFIYQYLPQYTKQFLLDNPDFQRRLTGFGLFFDYHPQEIRSKDHHIFKNVFLSPCLYFELIVLIMKVQFVLSEMNINYFIGRNTFLGALRHHDIVPWHSIIEVNLPFNSKEKFLKTIHQRFELVSHAVNDTYIDQKQIGFIYKIFRKNQTWPQIEITFYEEKSEIILGYLQKSDVFPLHLRPFGPLLVFSIHNPQAMIADQRLNICENLLWNHQLGKAVDIDHQQRIPCEQLHTVYSFVQIRYSWRRGYCEEVLKTKRAPHRTLSYFRYTCQENRTYD